MMIFFEMIVIYLINLLSAIFSLFSAGAIAATISSTPNKSSAAKAATTSKNVLEAAPSNHESLQPVFSPRLGYENQTARNYVEPNSFSIIKAGLNFQHEWEYTESKVNFLAEIGANDPRAFGVFADDAYFGMNDTLPFRLSIGRKLQNWSELEQNWETGQFEPLYSWDRLRPQHQGLTGVFANADLGPIGFHFFFSMLHLPEVQPNVVIDHGRFVSAHPQAQTSPMQTFNLFNRPSPLGYELHVPNYSKILARPSVGFSVDTNKDFPLIARFSYAHKPLNYFPVGIEGKLDMPQDQVFVDIYPRLLMQNLYAADLGYRLGDRMALGGSLLIDQPVEEAFSDDITTTPLSASTAISPWLHFTTRQVKLSATHIQTVGGLKDDVGPLSSTNQSAFSSHIYYRNASRFRALYQIQTNALGMTTLGGTYTREHAINANWIAADITVQPWAHFSLLIGGDMITAQQAHAAQKGAEFLSDVRALDRVRMGINYVF